jgi:hypothetical protein
MLQETEKYIDRKIEERRRLREEWRRMRIEDDKRNPAEAFAPPAAQADPK